MHTNVGVKLGLKSPSDSFECRISKLFSLLAIGLIIIMFILTCRHRLLQEIYCLLQSLRYKENLFMKTIKMHQIPVTANCTSWLGGRPVFCFVLFFLSFSLSLLT